MPPALPPNLPRKAALRFIVLLGLVSLLADITYEGARSITGPYLAILGASGAVVGIVSGFGEFIAYSLRFVTGYLSDRTGRYWLITFIGYFLNLFAVPLLAFAGHWPTAASLIILERFGKAIRSPARDAMLSYATQQTGRGWGFGLHEALDQIGAIIGPLAISLILFYKSGYSCAFLALAIPAIAAMGVLSYACALYPRPRELEVQEVPLATQGFTAQYWVYIAAIACVAAGFVDFPLIAYHFEKNSAVSEGWIPLLYAIAMATDGIAALLFGRQFDKRGFGVLIVATLFGAVSVPLVFTDGFYPALLGMVLWGIALGAQESIMRAAVANMIPTNKRATAYGVLNLGFGIAWFGGSALMGILYDSSITALVIISVLLQLAAIPCFISVKKLGAHPA